MQTASNIDFKDESTASLPDYLNSKSYRNLIPLSLILMFSIVFYFIYLIVDLVVDKHKQYKLASEAYYRYQAYKKAKSNRQHEKEEEISDVEEVKRRNLEAQRNIEFGVWSNRNLQISFIHSVICSIWLIRIIMYGDQSMYDDLFSYISWDTYVFLTFSCGYFLYDFYDIYANGYFRKEWVVCLHHWIVLLSFAYHLMTLMNLGYTTLSLVMEFNSVFLHGRKLLKFYGYKNDSLIVKLNTVMNVLTFTIFRFGVLIAIYLGCFKDGHRVSFAYLATLVSFTIMMSVINIILYKRILEKDVFSRFKSRKTLLVNQNQETNETLKNVKTSDELSNLMTNMTTSDAELFDKND
jgi:hypothetical protein